MWLNPYRYVVESIQKGVGPNMWETLPPLIALNDWGEYVGEGEDKKGNPLINCPVEELPQDIHQEKPSAKEEDA